MLFSNEKQTNIVTSECVSNYKACKDNADLINNHDSLLMIEARNRCKLSVNEHVKFGSPEWDWIYLTRFSDGNDYVKTGVIRIADYDVKIENQYGTKAHTKVVCSYDLESKKVLAIIIDGDLIVISDKPTTNTSSTAGESVIDELDKEQSDAKIKFVPEVNPSSNESTEKIDTSTSTQNTPAPQVENFDAKKEQSASEAQISSDTELSKNQDAQQHFYVQIGIFSDEANVKQLQDKLSDLGYKSQSERIDTARGQKIRLRTQEFKTEMKLVLRLIKLRVQD